MDNETLGILIIVAIGFLSFVGMGSILISILYDPDESSNTIRKYSGLVPPEPLLEEEQDEASVVLDANATFDFEQLKEL